MDALQGRSFGIKIDLCYIYGDTANFFCLPFPSSTFFKWEIGKTTQPKIENSPRTTSIFSPNLSFLHIFWRKKNGDTLFISLVFLFSPCENQNWNTWKSWGICLPLVTTYPDQFKMAAIYRNYKPTNFQENATVNMQHKYTKFSYLLRLLNNTVLKQKKWIPFCTCQKHYIKDS